MDLARRLLVGTTVRPGRAGSGMEVRAIREHQNRYALALSGIQDREAAEVMRETILYARESDLAPLAPGERYARQVVGLRVVTGAGESVGTIERVQAAPAHDLWEVRQPDGRAFLLPATAPFVQSVDEKAGLVTVRLIPGVRPGE